jgi:streptogramin lyase
MALPFPFPSGCSGFACFATSLPGSSLVFGPNGNLYGLYTVYQSGGSGLFEVQPDGGNFQLFPEYDTTLSGGGPVGLLLASDGNLWVTDAGNPFAGSSGYGAIVTLSPSDGAAIQTLAFFGGAAGSYPAELIQAKDGTLWGEAERGVVTESDHFAGGTVFSLNEGLPPL